jgi:hypothetical protein
LKTGSFHQANKLSRQGELTVEELNFDDMTYDEIAERLKESTPEHMAHLLNTWADTLEEQGFNQPVQMLCCAILRESAYRSIEVDEKLKEATENVMSQLGGIIRNIQKERTDECK